MNYNLAQLNKAYIKRFKLLNKNILTKNNFGLVFFIEYLRYLRDTSILTQKTNETAATLNAAIEEFEAYIRTNKDFHWNNFCEFVRLNMKEWLTVNDSV